MNNETKITIIMFGIVIIMFVIGLFLWFSIDSAIGYSYITNQIRTNQTFVDDLTCEDVKIMHNAGIRIISPLQQDNVNEMVSELKNLHVKKKCIPHLNEGFVKWKGE